MRDCDLLIVFQVISVCKTILPVFIEPVVFYIHLSFNIVVAVAILIYTTVSLSMS